MRKPDRPDNRIKALFSDVDGVWTDGGMYFSQVGQAMKRFDVKDGYIVQFAQRAGIQIVWVTGDDSAITRARARKLGIECVCPGVEGKRECVRALLESKGLEPGEVVFMGDDLSDLMGMEAVGIKACPADAVPAVLEAADWVTERTGGHGAVRELLDQIMAWNAELEQEGGE
ncbi:MAG: HAD family hydrolase [Armatimonadetes bacterium]|nr:HAD family hydrolase [Armatimonadota bacterium]MDI9585706.1 HAD family hydrolase [Acidobacteriota bacterium]